MKKILIVDDVKSILVTLEAILGKEGYFVAPCTNSIDAIDRFNAEHFDLVITDAIMPAGATGYTLISTIRAAKKNKDVPIIMLTGKREKADIEKALTVGANDYIIKPIDPDILLIKVRSILEQLAKKQTAFVEASVHAQAQITLKTEIITISESEIKVVSNYQLALGQLYRFSSDFFKQFDIDSVNTRIVECVKIPDTSPSSFSMRAQFVGLTDHELSKIRLWVRKKLSGV